MRRRRLGINGLQKRKQVREKFSETGEQLSDVTEQLEVFRGKLEAFAKKHRKQINKDPEFRYQFNKMCEHLGVDPLSASKGFWAEMLGYGDFYYLLGIQIIEICMMTRTLNGGLMDVSSVVQMLEQKRGERKKISTYDVERAIKKLEVLGKGFSIISVGSRKMVVSVQSHLNIDHTTVIVLAQQTGYFTKSHIQKELSWPDDRCDMIIDHLIKEGIVWIDKQADETEYWLPSLYFKNIETSTV